MRSGSTLWSATMSLKEFSDTVMIRCEPAGHLGLHVDEGVPAAQRELLVPGPRRASISRRRSTVMGWWIVPSTGMPSWRSMSEQAVAEALVVLDDVELALAVAEVVPGPHARRPAARGRCRR